MATSLLGKLMEQLQDQSLPTIGLLQESFPNTTGFMINISTLFDPRYVFLVYAPILFAINKQVGHRMIIALTIAEWANQILKWLLAGERPYWYVHEKAAAAAEAAAAGLAANLTTAPTTVGQIHHQHQHQQNELHQTLKQFPVTCELGAGSPSGHSMVAATVWYILIAAHLAGELKLTGRANYAGAQADTPPQSPGPKSKQNNSEIKQQQQQQQQLNWAKLLWSAYAIILVLISVSRVYLACHFPHQCLAGAVLGALLAKLVAERAPMDLLKRRHFACATWLMLAAVMGTYLGLTSAGFDPLWSVSKAMRWCAKKEYIHLDTTPFFSMTRYLGFCLGAGLAYDSSKIIESSSTAQPSDTPSTTTSNHSLVVRRALTALLSIGFGQFLLAIPAPRSSLNLFYVISFIIYTTFSYAIAGPIPDLVKRMLPASCKQHHHHHNHHHRQQQQRSPTAVRSNGFSRTFMKNRKLE